MFFKNFDKFSLVLHFPTLKSLKQLKYKRKDSKMHQHPQSINFELFLVVENHCVFERTYFEIVRFFPEMCVKNAKLRPKISWRIHLRNYE